MNNKMFKIGAVVIVLLLVFFLINRDDETDVPEEQAKTTVEEAERLADLAAKKEADKKAAAEKRRKAEASKKAAAEKTKLAAEAAKKAEETKLAAEAAKKTEEEAKKAEEEKKKAEEEKLKADEKKKQKEQAARSSSRDFSKFTISIAGNSYEGLNKRNLMFRLISSLIETGVTPEELMEVVACRGENLFIIFPGALSEREFSEQLMKLDSGGVIPKTKRYFCKEGELFVVEDRTYAMTNQWGASTLEAVEQVKAGFPRLNISLQRE